MVVVGLVVVGRLTERHDLLTFVTGDVMVGFARSSSNVLGYFKKRYMTLDQERDVLRAALRRAG